MGIPNTCLLLNSTGKASTYWCEFLAWTLTKGSLRIYTAATEVMRERIALPERRELWTSEGGHTMSIQYFIPTWFRKTAGELKKCGNARQEEKQQKENYWTFRKSSGD